MNDIKLIIADCDGTILHDDKTFDDELLTVIEQLNKKNIKFTINTGRNIIVAKWIYEYLKIHEAYVLDNGANIYFDQERILNHEMDKKDLDFILDLLNENDLPFLIMSDEAIYYCRDSVFFGRFKDRLSAHFPFLDARVTDKYKNESIYKIMVDGFYCRKMEEISEIVELKCDNLKFARSENQLYSITSNKASKYEGVKYLCEYYGISEEQVMTIGDNHNDIPMLKNILESVSMGQSVDVVKESSKYIADTNQNNGVSKFLKEYFKL